MKRTISAVILTALVIAVAWVLPAQATEGIGVPDEFCTTIPGEPTTTCDVWVTWESPTYAPDATDANSVGWPQTFVQFGQGTPTECETTYQIDRYVGTPEEINAVIGDGVLDGLPPEDSGVVQPGWYFKSTDGCGDPDPTPTPTPDPTVTPDPEPSVTPTPEIETGENVSAVGECVGDQWVVTTTTDYWERADNGEQYVTDTDVTTTSTYDPTCDPETPACGPIGSCGLPTVEITGGVCTEDYNGTFREIEVSTWPNGEETWVFLDSYDEDCLRVEPTPTATPDTVEAPKPELNGNEAPPAKPVVADVQYTG